MSDLVPSCLRNPVFAKPAYVKLKFISFYFWCDYLVPRLMDADAWEGKSSQYSNTRKSQGDFSKILPYVQ